MVLHCEEIFRETDGFTFQSFLFEEVSLFVHAISETCMHIHTRAYTQAHTPVLNF